MMFGGVVYFVGTCSVHAHSYMTTQLHSGKVTSVKYIKLMELKSLWARSVMFVPSMRAAPEGPYEVQQFICGDR